MDKDLLQRIGLTGHSADVYANLIADGPGSVSEIAKRTNLTRTNTYMLLEKLKSLGVISIDNSPRKKYSANNPAQLKNLLVQQQQEIQQVSKSLLAALPKFTSIYRLSHQQPGVLHFDGTQGIKAVYDDIIRVKKEVLIFPSVHDRVNPKIADFIDGQILRQQLAGIHARALMDYKDISIEQINVLAKKNVRVKRLRDANYDSQIIIYGDNVAFSTFRDTMLTTILTSPEIAQTHRAIFETIWLKAT